MGFQWQGIQPETFAQANPFLTGLQYGAQTVQDMANANIASTQAQYANPMIQAQLAQMQAQPALTQAQTASANSDAAKNYLIANNPALSFTNPIAGMVGQIQMLRNGANMTGAPGGSGGGAGNPSLPAFSKPTTGQQFTNPSSLQTLPGGLTATPQVPQAPGGQQSPQQGANGAGAIDGTGQIPNTIPGMVSWAQNLMAGQNTAQETAKTNVDEWNKTQDEVNDNANAANNMQNDLNTFDKSYKSSNLTGAIKGRIPVMGTGSELGVLGNKAEGGTGDVSNEQETDMAANRIGANYFRGVQGNHVTNMALKMLPFIKPNRALDPQAETQAVASMQAMIDRQHEASNFFGIGRQLGIQNPQVAKTLWNQYNVDRPAIDPQTRLVNQQYKGTYMDYLTPQTIVQAQTGQPIKATPVAADLQKQGALPQQLSIPSFNSKADFQSWYSGLPPAQQAQVKQKLGSN